MSSQLVTPIPSISFLSDIDVIRIMSSDISVRVSITIDDIPVIAEVYVPDRNGEIRILEVENAIKSRLSASVVGNLRVTYTSDESEVTVESTVIFCVAEIPGSTSGWLKSHFLTLATEKTIGSQWHEWITFYAQDSVTLSLDMTYEDGTTSSHVIYDGSSLGMHTLDITPSKYQDPEKQLVTMVATAVEGDYSRVMTYHIMQDYKPAAPRLIFRNSFGVEETFYCIGEHELKPAYDTQQASVEGHLKNIDIKEQRIFTANTGPLTTEMSNWADDLFRSEAIHLLQTDAEGNVYRGKEIVITSRKAERSNDDSFIPSFTFEYRLSQRNHNVFDDTKAGRIFDNTFDTQFD